MKVLIACEESQRVCIAFRKRGHEAYSADIQEPSGGHPEWHILGDVLPIINGDCVFTTMDGEKHAVYGEWDLIIAHPPCTYLSNVATRHHSLKCSSLEKINARTESRIKAMGFFMKFVNAKCSRIAIENPVCVMNTAYRKPDQIIEPYQFAKSKNDKENYVTKKTCLWLKGLDHLITSEIPKPDNLKLFGRTASGKVSNWEERASGPDRAKERSKTFEGIAEAMAEQWGGINNGHLHKRPL